MNSFGTEQSLILSLLREPGLLNQSKVQTKDFSSNAHRQIFQSMIDLDLSGEQIDIVTVAERAEFRFKASHLQYLIELSDTGMGSPENFDTYQSFVIGASRSRQAKEIAERLIVEVTSKSERDFVSDAIRDLMALDDVEKKYHYTIKEALYNAMKHVEEARNAGGLIGISTGISRIDEVTGGFQDTDLNIIAARPAMGKTALALNMMLNANCAGGLISAEQGNIQAALRFIAMQGSLDSRTLRTAQLDSSEWSRLSGAVIALQDRNMFINDKPRISIGDLVRQAREWKHNNDIKILFVDYLQKIQGSNLSHQRTEQVTEVTQQLKALARELKIPVVALAQVRRIDDRTDKRPKLGDMADASEIEKEADVIMTLYRDDVYHEDSTAPGIAEIDVVKNRHGQTGVVRCAFKGQYFQFKDLEVRVA